MESSTIPAESTLPEINWEELAEAASTIRKIERKILEHRMVEADPTRAADLARFEETLSKAEDSIYYAVNTANSHLSYPGSQVALRDWVRTADGEVRDAE